MSSSIISNPERIGAFTSSQIHRLMKDGRSKGTPGVPFYTYVDEKIIERKLGRSLDTGGYSKSAAWGIFMEQFVYENFMGMEYIITSNKTDVHPTIKSWAGSKDMYVKDIKVCDIKCFEPTKFCKLTDCLVSGNLNKLKNDFPQEYWQLVSNAIINALPKAESITFMPYKSQLKEIKEYASNYDGDDQWKYRFIYESPDELLPFIPDGNKNYKDLNKFEFIVPKEDKEALTERVKMASELLNK